MIDPHAGRIEIRRIRKARRVRRFERGIGKRRRDRKRIRFEQIPDDARGVLPSRKRRNTRASQDHRLNQAQAFIGDEEEGPVAAVVDFGQMQRTSGGESEIVLTQRGTLHTIQISEPTVGVEFVVSEIVEGAAMQSIRSRPCDDGHLRTGLPPVFGGIRRCLDRELLHRVHRSKGARSSLRRERRHTAARAFIWRCRGGQAEVGAHAVHAEVICARTLPVHRELTLRDDARRGHNDARRQLNQRLKTAPVQGLVFNESPVNAGGDGGRFSHQRSLFGDDNGLVASGDLKADSDRALVVRIDDQPSQPRAPEARLLDCDLIGARRDLREGEGPI